MDDREILRLFDSRSQQAVAQVRERYGGRLQRLALNLLGDRLDAEECVNDACLAAWNAIPPAHPDPLLPWLYKTVRHLCLQRYRHDAAMKRGGGGFDYAYEEMERLLADTGGPEGALEAKELGRLLNQFVRGLSPKDRTLFLGRYWYGERYADLAEALGWTENNCMVRASRLRQKLKRFLEQKGAM